MTDQIDQPWAELRRLRLEMDDQQCVNCGSTENLDVHHTVPKSRGGTDSISNLRTLCEDCHDSAHQSINIDSKHVNPADTKWVPTIKTVQRLLNVSNHPFHRTVILLLSKTGMGVQEVAGLDLEDVFLRPSAPDITAKVGPTEYPFIYVGANETGSGRGPRRRLCDTQFPLDREMRRELRRYLAIRPDSDSGNFLLSTQNWGEKLTNDMAHHFISTNAQKIKPFDREDLMLTPQRLIEFFKYRFDGQPATEEYLTGRREKMPYEWSKLVTDYQEGIFSLT